MIPGFRRVRVIALAIIAVPALFAGSPEHLNAAAAWGPPAAPVAAAGPAIQEAHKPPVAVTVVARKYSFSPARIEVDQDDIVKITLKAEDIPHSFTIDNYYRIAKRAAPGQPVTFQFRADQAGKFVYYCNLTTDERCKEMRGELVVNAKR